LKKSKRPAKRRKGQERGGDFFKRRNLKQFIAYLVVHKITADEEKIEAGLENKIKTKKTKK